MYCTRVLFHLKTGGVFIGRNIAKFTQKAIFSVIQLTVLVLRLKELKTINSNSYKKIYKTFFNSNSQQNNTVCYSSNTISR